jgi:hypothetical protein
LPTFALNLKYWTIELCRLQGLSCVQLFDSLSTFIQHSVNGSRYRERTTNDSANANKEAGEALASRFTVDDLHG